MTEKEVLVSKIKEIVNEEQLMLDRESAFNELADFIIDYRVDSATLLTTYETEVKNALIAELEGQVNDLQPRIDALNAQLTTLKS